MRLNFLVRAWKALPVPRNLRAAVSPIINWAFRAAFSVRPPPRRQSIDETPPGPMVVLGLLSGVLGIGSGARATVAGLQAAGIEPITHDISALQSAPLYARFDVNVEEPGGVWLAHCNAPELERLFWGVPARAIADRWRIGYWAWELEVLPENWTRAARLVHEIWAPSQFVANAITAATAGSASPVVRVMPHPSRDLSGARAERDRFGLDRDAFVVLTMFDARSTFARKNPEASIEAYMRAFPERGNHVLVCKVVASGRAGAAFEALKAGVAHRSDIIFMTEELGDGEVWNLIASADVVLSLHRSEGYGLVLAEAMQLSRVVVATGWSGNMDFMDDTCSVPVPYRLVTVVDPSGQYQHVGARWAEPDVAWAAAALKALRDDPVRRETLGRAAQARIRDHGAAFRRLVGEMPWLDKVRPTSA